MGQSFYTCDSCGSAMGDYSHEIEFCDCGKIFCQDCASEVGYRDEDYYKEETGEYHESTCIYCRLETIDDNELLDFALAKIGVEKEVFRDICINTKKSK